MSNAAISLSRDLQDIAKKVDLLIEQSTGQRVAFSLVVYTEGRASYVSNCDRKDAIEQLDHLLSLWKQNMPYIPAHEIS